MWLLSRGWSWQENLYLSLFQHSLTSWFKLYLSSLSLQYLSVCGSSYAYHHSPSNTCQCVVQVMPIITLPPILVSVWFKLYLSSLSLQYLSVCGSSYAYHHSPSNTCPLCLSTVLVASIAFLPSTSIMYTFLTRIVPVTAFSQRACMWCSFPVMALSSEVADPYTNVIKFSILKVNSAQLIHVSLQIKIQVLKWHFLRVWLAYSYSPVLGDHIYSGRVKTLMGRKIQVSPQNVSYEPQVNYNCFLFCAKDPYWLRFILGMLSTIAQYNTYVPEVMQENFCDHQIFNGRKDCETPKSTWLACKHGVGGIFYFLKLTRNDTLKRKYFMIIYSFQYLYS